jgi:hypothetical protein
LFAPAMYNALQRGIGYMSVLDKLLELIDGMGLDHEATEILKRGVRALNESEQQDMLGMLEGALTQLREAVEVLKLRSGHSD